MCAMADDPSMHDEEFSNMLALASFIGENREHLPHDVPAIVRHDLKPSCGPFGTRCGFNHENAPRCPIRDCKEIIETWCIHTPEQREKFLAEQIGAVND